MKIFLDTSSLFKLYHMEDGTVELQKLFSTASISAIFLSEISKVEFASAIWKKVRSKEIKEQQAEISLDLFTSDFSKYAFVATDSNIIEQARILTLKYGARGLRTLDGIQLSTCVSLSKMVDVFLTSDNLLKEFLISENLPVEIFANEKYESKSDK